MLLSRRLKKVPGDFLSKFLFLVPCCFITVAVIASQAFCSHNQHGLHSIINFLISPPIALKTCRHCVCSDVDCMTNFDDTLRREGLIRCLCFELELVLVAAHPLRRTVADGG